MAFIAGYVTKEQFEILRARGWEVEQASRYDLVGEGNRYLLGPPPNDRLAVVIFVDSDMFSIMSGPDWDKSENDPAESKKSPPPLKIIW